MINFDLMQDDIYQKVKEIKEKPRYKCGECDYKFKHVYGYSSCPDGCSSIDLSEGLLRQIGSLVLIDEEMTIDDRLNIINDKIDDLHDLISDIFNR